MALPSYAMQQANFAETYERSIVGPLFRPFAEMTVAELNLKTGDRVLDVACGTGIVARVAQERLGGGGHIVGVDVSPEMLAVARAVTPGIDWRDGNAGALPLRDGEQFDVVCCQQGLQFFPDKAAAAGEMRRALLTDGRLAVATWRSDDEIPFMRELRAVAERHVGPIVDQRHGFGDATVLEALLRNAGLKDVRVRTVWRKITFSADAGFERLNAMALVGMSAAGKSMSNEERMRAVEAIATDSASVVQRYAEGGGLAFDLSTNLAMARG
ncbi:MAG TPA: methyltransferase domain-containing protein [Hyphomicrobiaceae bacterium]|nr:methyltransferase domain-containing protein [Hyphomicrobiaceae bacterium]